MILYVFIATVCLYSVAKLYKYVDLYLKIKFHEKTNNSVVIILYDGDEEVNNKTSNTLFILYNIYKTLSIKLSKFLTPSVINIDLYDDFLKKYSTIPRYKRIDLILHSNGSFVKSGDIIVNCLFNHYGPIHTYILRYANSAATEIALCSNNISMNSYASLGPCDVQLPLGQERWSYQELSEMVHERKKDDAISELALITKINGEKVSDHCYQQMCAILKKFHPYITNEGVKDNILEHLVTGKEHDHDEVFNVQFLLSLGFRINVGMSVTIQKIFSSFVGLLL